jgi:NADPH:quinone reductase-like Zn-dependent oxidoreductase
MRAVQIRTFGEPGLVLELADLPEPPPPAAGEVLIGVEHAPINMSAPPQRTRQGAMRFRIPSRRTRVWNRIAAK